MRAVIIRECGGSPHVEDVPSPEVESGEVVIRVLAAGMSPIDRVIAAGGWESIIPATFTCSQKRQASSPRKTAGLRTARL